MKDYRLDDLFTDRQLEELTELAFGRERESADNVRQMKNEKEMQNPEKQSKKNWNRGIILAACAALAFMFLNFDSVMAAARSFVTYIVGQGRENEAVLTEYEVMEGPVAFEDNENYFVDMAYRRDGVLHFNISWLNERETTGDLLEVEIEGNRYRCQQLGGHSVTTVDTDTNITASREEAEYVLEDAPEGRTMRLYLNGYSATVTLDPPTGYAQDTVRTLDTGWMHAEFVPLSSECQVIGYTTETSDALLKDAYFSFSDARFESRKGEVFEADYVGGEDSFSHELVAVDAAEEEMTAFLASGIRYELGGWREADLGECQITVPERGETVEVDKDLEIAGIILHLKSVKRSELDHITLLFSPETNRGTLEGIVLDAEGSTGYSGGIRTDGISSSLNYSFYRIEDGVAEDGMIDPAAIENKVLIRTFPFKTGDEMVIHFNMIKGVMEQEIRVDF